jgi:hypothetical protein
MLKNSVSCALIALCVLTRAVPALGQSPQDSVPSAAAKEDQQQPVAPAANAATQQDAPLTVSGVTVDKTDKNAVIARTAAITEAKRTALQTLAARRLGADGAKAFKLPDDATISGLVQDFEITNEQLSATRYVAIFTVRFTPQVESFLSPAGMPPADKPPTPAPTPAIVGAAAPVTPPPSGPRSILVLPYLETETARLLLWEDANAWLKAWKDSSPSAPGWTIAVPLGDISDVAAGSSDAAWSGDYKTLDKLMANYGASEVVLAVATHVNGAITLDLYDYRAGHLDHLGAPPRVERNKDDARTYHDAAAAVIEALKNPPPAPPMPEIQPDSTPPASGQTFGTGTTGVPVALDAEMNFDSAARWLEMQKRLTTLKPPATVEIKSLTSSSAAFTLKFNGSFETLRVALAAHGVDLGEPVVEINDSIPGGAASEKPMYELKLVN